MAELDISGEERISLQPYARAFATAWIKEFMGVSWQQAQNMTIRGDVGETWYLFAKVMHDAVTRGELGPKKE